MPKVDNLKAKLNILGYGSSVEDNDIREALFLLEHIRTNLKAIYKRTDKRFTSLQESWGQGLYAKEAMEDYAHFMLEEQDQRSREIGKSCDAMRRACEIFESKQSAFYRTMRAEFCGKIKNFVKGKLREARYAHVEYERLKNKAGVDSVGMKAKVLQKMKEAIQYYNDNISEIFMEYIKIQRDYYMSAAKELDAVYASINPEAKSNETASVVSSHSTTNTASSVPQQSQQQTQFVHTVSTKIGAFPVLGVPLAALTQHGVETLGTICKVLVVTGVSCNGIYAQSRRERVAELKAMLSRKEHVALEKEDARDVAALLLAFFKELPEPLLTFSLCDDWIRCGDEYPRMSACVSDLILTSNSLPAENKATLQLLIGTLAVLCDYSNMNGATADVLASLYGPALIKERTQTLNEERKRRAIETVKRLIQHAEEVFPNCKSKCFSGAPPFLSSVKETYVPTAASGTQRNFLSTRGSCQAGRQNEVNTAGVLSGSLPNEFYAPSDNSGSSNAIAFGSSSLRMSQNQPLVMGSRSRGTTQMALEATTTISTPTVAVHEGGTTDASAPRGLMLGGARTTRKSTAFSGV